uniref:Uncharacterized protein n=1 Tax=Anguilla anguilla TaxID=7936 RepID=A0A0E9W5M1_ANGAN
MDGKMSIFGGAYIHSNMCSVNSTLTADI